MFSPPVAPALPSVDELSLPAWCGGRVSEPQAANNPLYDRHLPDEDLGLILRRIRAGIQPAAG